MASSTGSGDVINSKCLTFDINIIPPKLLLTNDSQNHLYNYYYMQRVNVYYRDPHDFHFYGLVRNFYGYIDSFLILRECSLFMWRGWVNFSQIQKNYMTGGQNKVTWPLLQGQNKVTWPPPLSGVKKTTDTPPPFIKNLIPLPQCCNIHFQPSTKWHKKLRDPLPLLVTWPPSPPFVVNKIYSILFFFIKVQYPFPTFHKVRGKVAWPPFPP